MKLFPNKRFTWKDIILLALCTIGAILAGFALLFLNGCSSLPSEQALCRHIVRSQYATFADAGYETRLMWMKNKYPERAGGFKYHVEVHVRKPGGKWLLVEQPKTVYTTRPLRTHRDVMLLREIDYADTSAWIKDSK